MRKPSEINMNLINFPANNALSKLSIKKIKSSKYAITRMPERINF